MKKRFYNTLFLIASLGSVGSALSCGEFGSNSNFVGIGSNSVSPLVMGEGSLMTKNPVGQYVYQNTGSGDGYKSQMQDDKTFASDFGMTSSHKNPESYSGDNAPQLAKLKRRWAKKKLRTVTYAFDAIGIGVNLPDGMKLKANSKVPIVNLLNLAKLYSKNPVLVASVTWDALIENVVNGYKWQSKKPIAIGIEGGKETSGKSEAFVKVIDKKLDKQGQNPLQEPVAINQDFSFTDNFNDIYTINKNTDGSVAYYSLGQISGVKLAEITLAAVDELSEDLTKAPTIAMVQTKRYRWSRPFNIIYSVDNDKAVAFANYLLSDKAQAFINEKSFVGLSAEQIAIQLPTWKPDLDYKAKENGQELLKGKNGTSRNGTTLNYGL